METVLRAEGITKSFFGVKVVDDVSVAVERGHTLCLLGPSGAGKSTLLRCLNQLERPDSGLVYLGGDLVGYESRRGRLLQMKDRELASQRSRMGMVFQGFNLFPHLTALENVAIAPTKVLRRAKAVSHERAREVLDRVGLSDKAHQRPNELSGGQQQRVAIARALAMDPDVILFDEPTSALDPEMVNEVLEVIGGLASGGTTMVIVTHEVGFAREVADDFVFMDQGKVVEAGPADALRESVAGARLAEFLSRVL